MTINGLIIKGIGGFYYVETAQGIFECKAKGKFRNKNISPVVGDKVTITLRTGEDNTIDSIEERKNRLVRPPVANIDKLIIAVSVAKPFPNTLIIDKMTVLAEKNGIEPIIVITKTDLDEHEYLMRTYRSAGYKVYCFSDKNGASDIELIRNELKGCITAFTGNSGVGKSTLINALNDNLSLATGEISDKLGRGRHTTRQAEIFHVADGLVIDTAGFSSIDFLNNDVVLSEDLQFLFKEFNEYIGLCRFTGCAHLGDKGCKICEMVDYGVISKSRYESYKTLYDEFKSIKKWQL